jgi:hypothetical protein
LIVGALLGALTARNSDDALPRAIIGGAAGGILTSQTRQVPLPLDDSLRAEMNRRGLTFVSIDRIGSRGARVSYYGASGYKTIDAHSNSNSAEQSDIDDDLFDRLVGSLA